MLGRSARENRTADSRPEADLRDRAVPRRWPPEQNRWQEAKRTNNDRSRRHSPNLPNPGCGSPQQAQNSNRSKECGRGCGTMVYATNVDAFTSYGMSGAACGARLRASAAGGCGPHGSKSRTTATANRSPGPAAIVPPRQPYFVILNEVKNLFPCEPKAADGLCRARRRKTNEVQSRIYSG